MISIHDLAGHDVGILGFGREGRAALKALGEVPRPPSLTVYTQGEPEMSINTRARFEVRTARATVSELLRHDWIVKSPGITPYRPPVSDARAAGARFLSGTHLWLADRPPGKVVCITGSKGKSTTAALTAHLLRAAGKRVVLAGNIGIPLLSIEDRHADVYVLELSSYQTRDFAARPDVALVLNLHPEHLNWHGDVDTYYRDKLKIFSRPAPACLINARDAELMQRTRSLTPRQLFNHASGYLVSGNEIRRDGRTIATGPWPGLPAPHQMDQVVAALSILDQLSIRGEDYVDALDAFEGLPHRLQAIGERDGLAFVDDSLATNPTATLAAASAFNDRPVTLLIGGLDRGLDWTGFVSAMVTAPAFAVVGVGRLGSRVVEMLRRAGCRAKLQARDTMELAVKCAVGLTPPGGVVVLSPGAPSQDAYKNYEERGRAFARAAGLAGKPTGVASATERRGNPEA